MSLAISEHLPLIAGGPYGIQKLRGLILELAVRGKLVPQDPKDESASELLNHIRQERSRLDGAKSPKKIERAPHASPSPLFELPSSWTWVPFGEIALHNSGKTLDKGRNAGQPREYITTSNLYWGHFEIGELKQMLIGEDELERCTARKNDLLICEGGEAGRAAVWPYDHEVCFQNHVHRARFLGDINPHFGFYFFEWLNASGEIQHYRKGVGISNMSGKALASIPFTLPPLTEQHRIVAKVDELMALCDRLESEQNDSATAHAQLVETLLGTLSQSTDAAEFDANWKRISEHFDTLFTTEPSIDALQKTILQLAIMGKLVSQNPSDEPASKLLMQIEQNRTKLELDGILKKQKPLPEPTDREVPFAIPCRWSWIRLADIAKFENGDRSKNYPSRDKFVPSGIPFINAGHLVNNRVDFSEMNFITEDCFDKLRAGKTKKGDVLFCLRGSLGKFGVLTDAAPSAIASSLVIIRLLEPKLLQYLEIYFSSPMIWGQISKFDNGTAQPNLGAGDLTKFVMPLPPIEELNRIVEKVDKLTALCDSLKNQLAESRKQEGRLADTLIQASLKAA